MVVEKEKKPPKPVHKPSTPGYHSPPAPCPGRAQSAPPQELGQAAASPSPRRPPGRDRHRQARGHSPARPCLQPGPPSRGGRSGVAPQEGVESGRGLRHHPGGRRRRPAELQNYRDVKNYDSQRASKEPWQAEEAAVPHPGRPGNPGGCSPFRRAAAWDCRACCRRSVRGASSSAGRPAG